MRDRSPVVLFWALVATALVLCVLLFWILSPKLLPYLGQYLPGARHRMLCVFYGKTANDRSELADRFRSMNPEFSLEILEKYFSDSDPRIRWASGWIVEKTELDIPVRHEVYIRIRSIDEDPEVVRLTDQYHHVGE